MIFIQAITGYFCNMGNFKILLVKIIAFLECQILVQLESTKKKEKIKIINYSFIHFILETKSLCF